ncbi:MAG: HEAT repeat domain-containing protein, partial [Nitrososphaerales archaeon]
ALEDEDWNVRRMAVLELRHGGKETFSALIKALRDRSKFVRRYAAYTLGRLGVLKSAPALAKVLNDPAPEVRDQAGWALRKIARRHGYRSWEELVRLRGGSEYR